ncbi:MAG: DNA alkylation repair protein [Rikenellaceae bacterium]
MNYTQRFTRLLGECRRQMNGAVVGSMRFYGREYGLNYGVSLPTIRSLAALEGCGDHQYAKYLYQQQVREIQIVALHLADPKQITAEEMSFWSEGIINSEIAEEAAFALFQHVDNVKLWLDSDDELLIYAAILSISKGKLIEASAINTLIIKLLQLDSLLIATAIIVLLENYYRDAGNQIIIDDILSNLPESKLTPRIIEEMQWRCECYK